MNKIKKLCVSVLFFGFIAIVGFSVSTYAADESIPAGRYVKERIAAFGKNGKYFDHVTYANTYPDVALLYGTGKAALWNHYISTGIYENRVALGTNPCVTASVQAYNVAAAITNEFMSDRDKALAIHDWIVNNTQYDYANYLAGTIPSISYTKEGVFLNHVAVCSGYADAFSYLSKIVGLKCENVDGIASSDGTAGDHAWNRVLIDGSYLYIDCTWDDPVCSDGSSQLNYNYFLIPYEAMSADHIQQAVYRVY